MRRSRRKSRELSKADTRRQLGTLRRIKRDPDVDTTKGGMPWPPPGSSQADWQAWAAEKNRTHPLRSPRDVP